MKVTFVAAALSLMAMPALADGHATGDAAAGEKAWNKCKSCHMIVSDDGTDIQKGGRTGPNLYNVVERTFGAQEGFKYSKGLAAAAEAGLMLDEATFVSYTADPTAWLKENVGPDAGRSKMTFKLRDEDEAKNIWAYLVSVGPEEGGS